MRTDRLGDVTYVTVAFNNLAKAPRNVGWWTCTNVSDRHTASTHGPEYKISALLQQSATYARSKPYSDSIVKVSHHFRLAQQWLAFRSSGMWHSITRLSVSPTLHSSTVPSSSEAFWWHSDTSQNIWNLSHHCNKQTNKQPTLNMTYGWHMFGILSPIRCHEGNGTTGITTFLLQLTESHLRINVQHYTVFKMMVMPFFSTTLFSAEYFLAHWLTITCWNKQTNITKYLSKYENVCIPTVYHWLHWSQYTHFKEVNFTASDILSTTMQCSVH
jgi:hypothetical protein